MKKLDVITMGRSSVDLYGRQVGGLLEDMASFEKYVGGSPANMAVGTARLGLNVGFISRVGDEHMGRFIREQMVREGVDPRGIITDPERLSALVILGIRDDERFPLIFYRENCADMALTVDDVDPAFIAEAGAVVVTGTHFSTPTTDAACRKAMTLCREAGGRTVLDIDYRPNLWGLAGHGAGEERFISSDAVTTHLQTILPLCDLVVGTEEELHIAGGTTDTLEAIRAVRRLTNAVIVCKRGAQGAVVFDGAIPDNIEKGLKGPGFRVEVFNVLGAGDGFMSGLLRGWLRNESWATTLQWANACGAFAVSRHGCAPAYPTFEELMWFLSHGAKTPALRKDRDLEHIHWATTRRGSWPVMRVLAFDHRAQLEEMAAELGADPGRIHTFKLLCLEAAKQVANGRPGYGILCDGRLGREALYAAAGSGLWIGRPVELPGSRPLRLEIGPDFGSDLADWPREQVIKVLCFYHPADSDEVKAQQEEVIVRLFHAARSAGLELLLEIIPSKVGRTDDDTAPAIMNRFYDLNVRPDWWKLEPLKTPSAWAKVEAVIEARDPWCRGIVILGLDAPPEELEASFAVAASFERVKGFAVGRTIFGGPARRWLKGDIDDATAIREMANTFTRLCQTWDSANKKSTSPAVGHGVGASKS